MREDHKDDNELARAVARLADEVEPLSDAELASMARMASTRRPHSTRSPGQHPRFLAGTALVALCALATLVSVEAVPRLRDLGADSAQARAPLGVWAWDQAVPGKGTPLAVSTRAADGIPNRLQAHAHEVIALTRGDLRFSLLAAEAGQGRLCFWLHPGSGGAVDCVSRLDEDVLVHFLTRAGQSAVSTTPRALVGIARSDVARVVVIRSDGGESELPLNRWRAFRYYAQLPERAPVRLDAYGSDGRLLPRFHFGNAPLMALEALTAA
ncbi:MAG: hypothetical protein H0U03_01930 [Actinobacteria bacterium]|nr:hypothetical protein [Actinomycetota bacterium]